MEPLTAIEVVDVSFAYGTLRALDRVTFAVGAGETVALLGPNGAGKTTLTKLIVGLLKPSAGRVSVAGTSTEGRGPEDLAAKVAYVFQRVDHQLFARTVGDEIEFGPRMLGRSAAEARVLASDALDQVGFTGDRTAHPFDFPPATRKQIAVASALAQAAPVLLLDEPTQGLDRIGARRLGELLAARAKQGTTVMMVSHDLSFVSEYLERAIVLAEGRLVADEDTPGLLSDPARAASLGLVAPPAVRIAAGLALPGRPVTARQVAQALRTRAGTSHLG